MSNIIYTGISALMAYQAALNVASQNIANANTPYFSRREIIFSELPFSGGVGISDVRRIVDDTVNRYAQASNSDYSQWSVYLQQLTNFEPLFDDKSTNVGKFITDSLAALQQLQTNLNPNNRGLFMGKLEALAQQFKHVNGEINRQLQNVNLSLQTEIKQVNNILDSIFAINTEVLSGGERPDLLDKREALVQEVAKYFNFSAIVDQNGKLDIVLTNGMSLLSGATPVQLTPISDPNNPSNLIIGANTGTVTIDITQLIQSGEIAGWLNYRENGLASAQAGINRIALVIADALNAQNHLGIEGDGSLGGDIFADINNIGSIAQRVIDNSNNTGSLAMTVNIDDTSALLTSNYRFTMGPANTYVLTRLSDNTIVGSGSIPTFPQAISADGFTINVTGGSMSAGDQYLIVPTRGAANNFTLAITDSSQLALGWPVNASEGIKSPGNNATIKVTGITDITTSAFATPGQLTPPIEIRFSVSGGITQYSLYNATTDTLIEGPITYDPTTGTGTNIFPTPGGYDPGYRVTLSGNNIQNGDTFNITYNTNTYNDNRNAIAMADLYQVGTILDGAGQLVSFNQGYQSLSNEISIKTNAAKSNYDTSFNIKEQAEKRRDMVSGVSLEEEALDLASKCSSARNSKIYF